MKDPLWEPEDLPHFAAFFEITNIHDLNEVYAIVVSWNQLVQNPQPHEKLLGISIRPISKKTLDDKAFTIQTCGKNLFKLGMVITSFHKLRYR